MVHEEVRAEEDAARIDDSADYAHSNLKYKINDWQFIRDLKRLKELRSFLIQEAVSVVLQDSRAFTFGQLNMLQYDIAGRLPSQAEWEQVESQTQLLFGLMTDTLRRKFILGEIPSWVSITPMVLAGVSLASLTGAVIVQSIGLFHTHSIGASTLPFYLIWLMSLGAIGSIAFIGMNALSVQQDITFDLSNKRLMVLRIVLGALFALVLTLPFGFQDFLTFIGSIIGVRYDSPLMTARGITNQAMLLLLPFILGFSTSLVIMILNRLVDAVQAFFGRPGNTEKTLSPSPAPSPLPAMKTNRQ